MKGQCPRECLGPGNVVHIDDKGRSIRDLVCWHCGAWMGEEEPMATAIELYAICDDLGVPHAESLPALTTPG